MNYADLSEVVRLQHNLAVEHRFTYLLGPIKVALRPRVISAPQIKSARSLWSRPLVGLPDVGENVAFRRTGWVVKIEEEELEIARMQPWGGGPAIIASDGLFDFGASPEPS